MAHTCRLGSLNGKVVPRWTVSPSLSGMRTDWLPLSASALVIGAMALVFGGLVNPTTGADTTTDTLRIVSEDGGRWLAMAVMYFLASVSLMLGLPAILSLFTRRGRRMGLLGVGVFSIGVLGTAGYSVLMVFFRALVANDAVDGRSLDQVAGDAGLSIFLYVWIAGFYVGVLLIAIALFLARKTPRWVPFVLVGFVALLPFGQHLGRLGMAVQVLGLAVAFTGIAIAAISDDNKRELAAQAVL
jgi:MFS family permease